MFRFILNWSEVWATMIPLVTYFIIRPGGDYLKPVFIYLIIALVLFCFCDITREFYHSEPEFLRDNNYVYNLSSMLRLFLFTRFFFHLEIPERKNNRRLLLFAVATSIIINFILNNFFEFSSFTFTLEGTILIVFCVVYFLRILRSDEVFTSFNRPLIIITGLAVYESISFPIFLTYNTLIKEDTPFAINVWYVQNIAYIVFCLYLTRAFYGERRTMMNTAATNAF